MIRNRLFYYVTLVFILTFFSCKKDEIAKPNNDNDLIDVEYNVEGVEWILAHGYVYVEDLENGDKSVYEHFGDGKSSSNLHIVTNTSVSMDVIDKDLTRWTFNDGTFTLNNSKSYEYDYVSGSETYFPFGLETGTARPIQVLDVTKNKLVVKVTDSYNNDTGSNINFWSVLTFYRAGTSCNNCQPGINYGYNYKGVLGTDREPVDVMYTNETWVVTYVGNTKLLNDAQTNVNRTSDTLYFNSGGVLTIRPETGQPYQGNYLSTINLGTNRITLTIRGYLGLGYDYNMKISQTQYNGGLAEDLTCLPEFNEEGVTVKYLNMKKINQ